MITVTKLKQQCGDGRHVNGMTFVELLVVVAVISVLIAILLPALSFSRATAYRMKCQSNLKSIAQAWILYLDDNDGRFLQGKNTNIIYGGWRTKNPTLKKDARPLNTYLNISPLASSESVAKVFECPCDTGSEYGVGTSFYTSKGTSYQTNILLIGPDICEMSDVNLTDEVNRRREGLNRNQVDNENRLLLVGDYGWSNCWQPGIKRIGAWHQKRCGHNLAFLGGHVRFLNIRKGILDSDDYTVLPFEELYPLARSVQVEEECK